MKSDQSTILVKLLQDRVDYLERVIAYEARVIEAQTLDLKSLGVGRRRVLTESVEAMRQVVREGTHLRYSKSGALRERDALRSPRGDQGHCE